MTVYFVRAAKLNLMKIGYTASETADKRIAQLQTGQPFELFLLGTIPGGRDAEAGLHREFAGYRGQGEWFDLPPEAMELISLMIEQKAPWYICRVFTGVMKAMAALRQENERLRQRGEEKSVPEGLRRAITAERKLRQVAEDQLETLRIANQRLVSSTSRGGASLNLIGGTSAITHEATGRRGV